MFTTSCAACHGASGEGGAAPALVGENADLAKYETAQGLLEFISTNMPADAPGSLPMEQYQQVLAFALLQNNLVTDDETFNPDQLSDISLNP